MKITVTKNHLYIFFNFIYLFLQVKSLFVVIVICDIRKIEGEKRNYFSSSLIDDISQRVTQKA